MFMEASNTTKKEAAQKQHGSIGKRAKGILAKYASERLRDKEKDAFIEAMKAKHQKMQ